jgi:hypothetical protein
MKDERKGGNTIMKSCEDERENKNKEAVSTTHSKFVAHNTSP